MRVAGILFILLLLGSCSPDKTDQSLQGYVEGRQIFLAPQASGILTTLNVTEGEQVRAGKILFSVDSRRARARLDESLAAGAAAKSRLRNLKKAGRPEEIKAVKENLKAAEAILILARQSYTRSKHLVDRGVSAIARLDRNRATLDNAQAQVTAARARLALIRLPARADVIMAAIHDVAGREAAIVRARTDLQDRRVIAPVGGRIETVFRRMGEIAGPGKPVVALLSPDQMRIRFFVHEPMMARVHYGEPVTFQCDNCPAGEQGKIVYISHQAEFTPPIIFSEKERVKLVYMIEARPDHPGKFLNGQPVGVLLQ